MAFVTGSAADQLELMTALIDGCLANGFTMANAVLKKGNLFVRPWQKVTAGWGNHFFLEMGKSTDVPEAVIVDSLGSSVGPGGSTLLQPSAYPITYDLHIFDNEVFMVCWDASDRHFWVAFGQSSPTTDTPAAGQNLWAGGTQTPQLPLAAGTFDGNPIVIGATIGGCATTDTATFARVSAGLFWNTHTSGTSQGTEPASVYTDSAGAVAGGRALPAGGAEFEVAAIRQLAPLVARQANAWNSHTVLLPIQLTSPIPATSNRKLDIQIKNAHYFRLDAVSPRDIITVDGIQYKVYPWYKRNPNARNGSGTSLATKINHTGTFGWAIKYTGP